MDTPSIQPRTVFFEENGDRYLKLVAVGEIDETLFEGLEAFIGRQRRRLQELAPGE